MKDLNITPKTIKLVEENIRKKLHDIRSGNDFMNMTLKNQATKEKRIDKLNFIKIKKLLCIQRHSYPSDNPWNEKNMYKSYT